MTALLGYIPFVDPINLFHEWWYLLIVPLAWGIAIIYKALRLQTLEAFWREVFVMTAQIVLAMLGLAIALVILVVWIVPMTRVE